MTYEKLIRRWTRKLQFPGLDQHWTMPVENRLDMELTGIKTPVGMKIQGPSLDGIQQARRRRFSRFSPALPQMRSVFAERVSQGFYVNVEVNRPEAARYGLTVADVQQARHVRHRRRRTSRRTSKGANAIRSTCGTSAISATTSTALRRVLIATPSGAQIPLGEVAKISFSHGPAMIRDEDGAAHRIHLPRSEHDTTTAGS